MKKQITLRHRYPRRRVIRTVLRNLIHLAFFGLTRFNVIGRENFPKSGPILIVANHFHFADPAVILKVVPRQVEFLAGSQMPNAPLIVKWIPRMWGVFHVHRDGTSREAMRGANAVLQQRGFVGVFPEAGSWAAVLRPARPGTAFLATQANVPLLPIGITGMNDIFPKLQRRERADVTAHIGQPFGPFSVEGRGRQRRERLEEIGHEIMQRIAALLPPEQQGCYSPDPAIREAAQVHAKYPWE